MLYLTRLTEHGRFVSQPLNCYAHEKHVRGFGRTQAQANAEVRAEIRRIRGNSSESVCSGR